MGRKVVYKANTCKNHNYNPFKQEDGFLRPQVNFYCTIISGGSS